MLDKKITIVEIAEEAGVATATVSRVLNGTSRVREETRNRVLKVIKKYNYKPSSAARNLVKNESYPKVLGVIIPRLQNQFTFEVLNNLYRQISGKDYNILIFNIEKGRKEILRRISWEGLSGLFLFGDPPVPRDEQELIKKLNIPYLYFDHHEQGDNSISFDNSTGGKIAAEYLLRKGCRHITFCGLTNKTQQQEDRLASFNRRLKDAGLKDLQEIYIAGEEASYSLSRSLMENHGTDGIFYFSDQLAYGGIRAKRDLHSEISVIGYDDIFPSEYMQLSTLRQSSEEIASTALAALKDMIESPVPSYLKEPVEIILQPCLIDRGS